MTTAMQIPVSALLVEERRLLRLRSDGPDSFRRRREVEADVPRGGVAMVRRGLGESDEVVVEGGFKLKAMSDGWRSKSH